MLDTMAIENFVSVQETEGPKFATALEQHVKQYDVDIMDVQRADALIPGDVHQIRLANGAVLKAKTIILATGARWREINVPGEREYRNRGVAYCPHCDGPLFRGKRVAVVGGGNSGVEAAIDLAGIVKEVTLIEYGAQLRADEVLQRKLRSLPNVTIVTQAQTTELTGDGSKLNGPSTGSALGQHAAHRSGRRVRADRPRAEHRMAERHGRTVEARRDRRRCARRDVGTGRVRGRRCDDGTVQADRDRGR